MTQISHRFPIRIYYEDTDAAGFVYYANYLRFLERARTEFLRAGGVELDELAEGHGVMFMVTRTNIRYLAPARFNDLLQVETAITGISGVRVQMKQIVWREQDRLVDAELELACTTLQGRPARIPRFVRAILRASLSKEQS